MGNWYGKTDDDNERLIVIIKHLEHRLHALETELKPPKKEKKKRPTMPANVMKDIVNKNFSLERCKDKPKPVNEPQKHGILMELKRAMDQRREKIKPNVVDKVYKPWNEHIIDAFPQT